MTKTNESYRKSGTHDAENQCKEFVKFTANYSVVYAYALVLMPEASLDKLGRSMSESEHKDTGRLIFSGISRRLSTNPVAENHRRQRQRGLEMTNYWGSYSSSPTCESVSSMVTSTMAAQQQHAALMFFANQSNDYVAQERPLAILVRHAFCARNYTK